jgi:sugar phosphate isomerase/epimerase
MTISRRDFLNLIQLFSVGSLIALTTNKLLAKTPKEKINIGIQLWSVRNELENDLFATLKALSDMGVTGIEPYNFDGKFYGIEPRKFKKMCDDINLKIYSTHTPITIDNAPLYVEKALEAGLEYLILPSLMNRPRNSISDYQKVTEELNAIGEICLQHNIIFGYHNHSFEFIKIDGSIPYDILLKETDPQLVSFQCDIYWLVKAGYNPADYFKKYPHRFKSLHIKDMNHDGDSCIVGNGTIDFPKLLISPGLTGNELIIYEQEHYSEGAPLYCAQQSIQNIQSKFFK